MNRIQEFYIKLNTVLADIFFSAFVFCLVENRVHVDGLSFVPWIIIVFAVFIVNFILAAKGVKSNIYFAFNVIAILFLSIWGQRLIVLRPDALSTRILFGVALSFPIVRSAVIAFREPSRQKNLLYFDALVLLEIIFVGLGDSNVFPVSLSFRNLGMIAVAGTLSSLMLYRLRSTDDTTRKKRIIGETVMISFIAFVSAIALLASNAFENASQSLIGLGKIFIVTIFNGIVWVLNLFLKWLSSIITTVIIAEVPEIKIKEFGIDKSIYDGKWFVPILIFLIFLGIFAVYMRLRGSWVKNKKNARSGMKLRRESNLVRGMSKLFRRISGTVRFIASYISSYNKVSGLAVWTEIHYKKRFVSRKKEETYSSFILRIADRIESEETRSLMEQLALLTQQEYFSDKDASLPQGFASRYRKAVRRNAKKA